MSFRAEMATKAATDGHPNDVQQFSSAMDSASRKVKREAQRDESQDNKPSPRTTAIPKEQNMVQRPNSKLGEQSSDSKNADKSKESGDASESTSPIDNASKTQQSQDSAIADYFKSLTQTQPMPTGDTASQPEQSSTSSELSTSAAQTAAILALLDFQPNHPPLPNELPELDYSIGSSPPSATLLQVASATIHARASTSYTGLPIPSVNSLQDESANLISEAPSQTPLLNQNSFENNFALSLSDASPMTATISPPSSMELAETLDDPKFSPLQTFQQIQPDSWKTTSNGSGTIAMGNGDEFAQSTTSFLVRAHANGSHEAVLKVSPEHLGPLRADIAMNELPDGTKSMSLTLTLSNEQAMDMAKESLGKLQSELALAGISCPTIQLKLDTPIAAAAQNGASEGSLHSSSNPSSGQQSHRDDSRSKRISYEEQAAALSPMEQSLTIGLFDRTV